MFDEGCRLRIGRRLSSRLSNRERRSARRDQKAFHIC